MLRLAGAVASGVLLIPDVGPEMSILLALVCAFV
jgi:hypothetical protein